MESAGLVKLGSRPTEVTQNSFKNALRDALAAKNIIILNSEIDVQKITAPEGGDTERPAKNQNFLKFKKY